MQVFLCDIRIETSEARRECLQETLEWRLDRQRLDAHAERMRLLCGKIVAEVRRVTRRQPRREHVVRAERIDCEREHQCRIDAAGKSEHGLLEPVLVQVVAGAAYDRAIGQRRTLLVGFHGPLHTIETSRCRIEVGDQQVILERRGRWMNTTIAIGQARCAIEHDAVLPANHVEVGDRDAVAFRLRLAAALCKQGIALRGLVALERRRVRREHDLRAERDGGSQRFGEPEVFADHQTDADAIDIEHARSIAGRKIAALIEHRIVGQFAFAIRRFDTTVAQHTCGIEHYRPCGFRMPDHRDDAMRRRRNSCERGCTGSEEIRPLQQIFGRITRQRQFWKQNNIRAMGIARFDDQRGDTLGVGDDRADREIELGERDAQGNGYFFVAFMRAANAVPRSPGDLTVTTPAVSSAANLPAAVPLPPEAIAPA